MLLFVMFPDVDNYLCARNFCSHSPPELFCTNATVSPFPVALSSRLDIQGNRAACFQAQRVEHDQTVWVWWMKHVLRTNPGEPQFPGRPQRIIKKKSGHIIITRVLFLTVLQLDVRHQSPTAAARRADPNAGRKRGTTLLPPCPRHARLPAPHWTGNTLSLEARGLQVRFPPGAILWRSCMLHFCQRNSHPVSFLPSEVTAHPVVQGKHGYTGYTHFFFIQHWVYLFSIPSDAHHSVVSAKPSGQISFHRMVRAWPTLCCM